MAMMKHYYCKKCGFSGTRWMVRKHLREHHMINKKKIGKKCDNFYSIDEKGERRDYHKKTK
jgi:hypothetical protein